MPKNSKIGFSDGYRILSKKISSEPAISRKFATTLHLHCTENLRFGGFAYEKIFLKRFKQRLKKRKLDNSGEHKLMFIKNWGKLA